MCVCVNIPQNPQPMYELHPLSPITTGCLPIRPLPSGSL